MKFCPDLFIAVALLPKLLTVALQVGMVGLPAARAVLGGAIAGVAAFTCVPARAQLTEPLTVRARLLLIGQINRF